MPRSATASRSSTPPHGRTARSRRVLLDRRPLDEPPFYVVEAAPAITFTFGGLLIDAGAHALAADGNGRSTVPGLLAAGADAGGLYQRAYAGGLAPALVFGLAAARTALGESPTAPAR
ncbi:FAD-binding protein [Streptomyces griseorubiginosus]|uniref:FAD-binding protein n=1 Tax=Streptomyces griseorubiginosus TaxID=67304 RepID=UPI0036E2D17D